MTTTSPPSPPIPPYLKNVKKPTSPSKVEVQICMDLRSDHKHDHDRIDYRRYLSDYHWVISMWKIQIFFQKGEGSKEKKGWWWVENFEKMHLFTFICVSTKVKQTYALSLSILFSLLFPLFRNFVFEKRVVSLLTPSPNLQWAEKTKRLERVNSTPGLS